MPSEAEIEPGSPSAHNRLTAKVQTAFDMACSQQDLPVAELLYACLEHLARDDGETPDRQPTIESLADSQTKVAALRGA